MTARGQEVLNSFNKKQRQILPLLAEGRSNKDIAARLSSSEQVVKNYVGIMLRKSGMDNRHAPCYVVHL